LLTVANCSSPSEPALTRPDNPRVEAAAPQPSAQPVQSPTTPGELPLLLVSPVVSGTTVTTTVENNTGLTLVFHTAIQFLTPVGADVIPPVVGPDLTVASGSTSSPWVYSLPPLPDGFVQVPVSATATDPATGLPMLSSFALYFQVTRGTPVGISFGAYYEATSSELVQPLID
jgi:hypothetical protein